MKRWIILGSSIVLVVVLVVVGLAVFHSSSSTQTIGGYPIDSPVGQCIGKGVDGVTKMMDAQFSSDPTGEINQTTLDLASEYGINSTEYTTIMAAFKQAAPAYLTQGLHSSVAIASTTIKSECESAYPNSSGGSGSPSTTIAASRLIPRGSGWSKVSGEQAAEIDQAMSKAASAVKPSQVTIWIRKYPTDRSWAELSLEPLPQVALDGATAFVHFSDSRAEIIDLGWYQGCATGIPAAVSDFFGFACGSGSTTSTTVAPVSPDGVPPTN